MNYTHVYNMLMESRQILNRIKVKGDGLEVHHIIPRSLGGSNSKSNLVVLTAREHYLAHLLLIKMHEGRNKAKMVYAFHRMNFCNGSQARNSKDYDHIRSLYSKHVSGPNHPRFGVKRSNEFRERMMGHEVKSSTRKKIGDALRGIPKSNEHKDKISKALTGRTLSDKTKVKMSQSRKGKSQPLITCPHCAKQGTYSAMHRWHMDRCKMA